MNKKAALELSITAIVVMIIAITVLSLAIFFIKNLFGQSTELFQGQFAQIKQKLVQDLKDSGELLGVYLPVQEVSRGTPQDMAIAIRNTNTKDSCYGLEVDCLSSYGGGDCAKDVSGAVVVGGGSGLPTDSSRPSYATGSSLTSWSQDVSWFTSLPNRATVRGSEADAIPVTMLVRNAAPDTYKLEFSVYENDQGDCSGSFAATPLATKTMYLAVK